MVFLLMSGSECLAEGQSSRPLYLSCALTQDTHTTSNSRVLIAGHMVMTTPKDSSACFRNTTAAIAESLACDTEWWLVKVTDTSLK